MKSSSSAFTVLAREELTTLEIFSQKVENSLNIRDIVEATASTTAYLHAAEMSLVGKVQRYLSAIG